MHCDSSARPDRAAKSVAGATDSEADDCQAKISALDQRRPAACASKVKARSMPMLPGFRHFCPDRLGGPRRPRLSPTLWRRADARRSLPADRTRSLFIPLRERRGGREDRPLQLPGRRSVPADRSLRQRRRGDPRREQASSFSPPIRCAIWSGCSPQYRAVHLPGCRGFAAGPSVMPATTSCATASDCPTRRTTTVTSPTWRSRSTTAW